MIDSMTNSVDCEKGKLPLTIQGGKYIIDNGVSLRRAFIITGALLLVIIGFCMTIAEVVPEIDVKRAVMPFVLAAIGGLLVSMSYKSRYVFDTAVRFCLLKPAFSLKSVRSDSINSAI